MMATKEYEEAKQAMKEASEQHHGHIFSMISNSFSSVFTYVWFYFVIILPSRSWAIRTVATTEKADSRFSKCWSKCERRRVSKCGCGVSLVGAPVFGLVMFYTYYYAFVVLKHAAQPLVGLYRGATEDLPVYVVPLLLPLIVFLVYINDFSKLSFLSCFTMYAYIAATMYTCGIVYTLLFFGITLMSLHVTYRRTSAGFRCFFRIFAIFFCHKAVIKEVSQYYVGILPPLWNAVLLICVAAIYSIVTEFIHGKMEQTLLIRDNCHEQFFQRGSAQVQMQYVKQQGCIFSFVMAVAAICTFGQFASSSTHDAPDTMANVYCKVDPTNQLQCLVNVTYDDPIGFKEERGVDDSPDWDFCGMLPSSCARNPLAAVNIFIVISSSGTWQGKPAPGVFQVDQRAPPGNHNMDLV